MARKDITDVQVVAAFAAARAAHFLFWPYDLLAVVSGQCIKVCYRAMERAEDRGLIDSGVSLRTGWLTKEGTALLQDPASREPAATVFKAGEALPNGASRA